MTSNKQDSIYRNFIELMNNQDTTTPEEKQARYNAVREAGFVTQATGTLLAQGKSAAEAEKLIGETYLPKYRESNTKRDENYEKAASVIRKHCGDPVS